MKLKTETGEMLVLDEAQELYISEDATSDTSIDVSEVDALLESGDLEIVAEESDEVVEATEPKANKLKKKKIKADGSGEVEVFEDEDEDGDDEDEDDEVEEDKKVIAKEEVELEVDVKEDMNALFDGQELTEDFKSTYNFSI